MAIALCGCGDVVVSLGDVPSELDIPTDPSVEPAARLIETPTVCSDNADALSFELRETSTVGSTGDGVLGGGLFAADLDSDGFLDLGAPTVEQTTAWVNRGGEYQTDACFYGFDLTDALSATPIDHDLDGDLDLFVTRWNAPAVMLRNYASAQGLAFVDDTAAAGLGDVGTGLATAFGDLDLDGDLDLFVGGYDSAPRLYENLGGTFTDASDRLPDALADGHITAASWFDPDRDGLLDLYVVRDFDDGRPNLLLRNDGAGGLELDHNRLGLDVVARGTGLAIGDVNGDQFDDLLVAERGGLQLRLSRGDWWEEVSHEVGLRPGSDQLDAWGVALGDVDNDGDLDAAIAYGPDQVGQPGQPDALFLQQDDGSFVDVAPELGLNHDGVGRGLLMVDADADGWLDVVTRDLAGPGELYLSECGDSTSLSIELRQPGFNARAVGARIRVLSGDRVWVRRVAAGTSGFASAGPSVVHVGLGDLQQVDRIDVEWPDGRTNRFYDVAAGQALVVVREE